MFCFVEGIVFSESVDYIIYKKLVMRYLDRVSFNFLVLRMLIVFHGIGYKVEFETWLKINIVHFTCEKKYISM